LQAVVDAYLAPPRPLAPAAPRRRIVIDLVRARALQSESDQVREMLLAGAGEGEPPREGPRLAPPQGATAPALPLRPAVGATGEVEGTLPDGWDGFVRQLDECQRQVLRALCWDADPSLAVNRLAEEYATMPQFLLDSINQVALDTIGDIIILPDADPPAIEEDDLEAVRQVVGRD